MEVGFEKTLVFLVFIVLGILLKIKFNSQNEINGIKKIILNLALPATIFIALLGIKVRVTLMLLPILALVLNFVVFAVTPIILPFVGIAKNTPAYRTARLLIPSLAPGLSCFPFILEFLGEDYLAKAAMADLGNKIFVLIVLYMIAMHWFYIRNDGNQTGNSRKIKSLLKALVTEPVNLFIALALVLLFFGLNMDSLPFVISESLKKLSLMMTPLVLLFIGLAVKIKRKQFYQIFSMLLLRAGMVFFLVALLKDLIGISLNKEILLALAFGLSACSFWPYAHICLIDDFETDKDEKTFDNSFAIGVLALSFPLSTILILVVLNSGQTFSSSLTIWAVGLLLLSLGLVFPLIKFLKRRVKPLQISKTKLIDSTRTEQA